MVKLKCTAILLCLTCWYSVTIAADRAEFRLISQTLPEDLRLIPAVGNGHIATQVYHDTVYMNNVYNGMEDNSHRARIPSPVAITPTLPGDNEVVREQDYELDMYRGIFISRQRTDDLDLEQRIYAHRSRQHILVNEITVKSRSGSREDNEVITLDLNWGNESLDLDLQDEDLLDQNSTRYMFWETKEPEYEEVSDVRPVHMFWTDVPSSVELNGVDSTWRFIASLSVNKGDAEAAYKDAKENENNLMQEHVEKWDDLWKEASIDVQGNETLAQIINSCLFHILISLPDEQDEDNQFAGLSPGGLARGGKISEGTGGPYNDYAGHVFWDMDTWIMPPVMLLHPQFAPTMISSRTRVMENVRKHAQDTGYQGVRFPWEQAHTGLETCPWEPASLYQFHVTADVAYSVRQYLYMTADTNYASQSVIKTLIMEIARFWESRVTKEGENRYGIHGVMGPDEYNYNINNSVFTNYNAKLALTTPQLLMDLGGTFNGAEREEITTFNDIAEDIIIIFDEENQFHPQYEGFPYNATIKQSDVVLLGYPLMMEMTRDVRRNDLIFYEDLTDEFGPDTGTWSMHTVGWLELGDEDKAAQMFSFMFRNINGPFNIFSEKPDWGPDGMRATNFITLSGGMLQSILFGYGGIRQRQYFMEIDPYVLPTTNNWKIKGLHFRRNVLDLGISRDEIEIGLREAGDEKLYLFKDCKEEREVAEGAEFRVSRSHFVFVTESDKKTYESDICEISDSGCQYLRVSNFLTPLLFIFVKLFV